MKAASGATLAILASGQFLKAEIYKFTLVDGATNYYFTNHDAPLTVGGQLYQTGLTIKRSSVSQKVGLDQDSLTLDICPQADNPGGAISIGGYPFLQACRAGVLDAARMLMSKCFLSSWDDTSPGKVDWYQGRVDQVQSGRMTAQLQITSDLELLKVSMPRNILQTGCLHTLFDAGCTLSKATFTSTGSVTGSSVVLAMNSGLTQPDGYFDLGTITFTGGLNSGLTRTIKRSLNASGYVEWFAPLPNIPLAGDTFSIAPGCDKRQTTCSTKFSNILHFRGYPYVPVPETLYSGGTAGVPVNSDGTQYESVLGSAITSSTGQADYQP